MSKRNSFILLCAALLTLAVLFAAVSYAWLYFGDDIDGIEYSIAKIDSSVVMYFASDSNGNGIPDRLAENTEAKYYVEQYSFEKKTDEIYALSEDSEANTLAPLSIQNVFPSYIYTLKYELTNRSTADNRITFKLCESWLDSESAALLSTLSLRLGIVSADTPESGGTVSFGEKLYLSDYISGTSFTEATLAAMAEDVFIKGMTGMESADNYLDFWLRVEMEPYEQLTLHDPSFAMTESEYNALQGSSAVIPNLYIYFEIIHENET